MLQFLLINLLDLEFKFKSEYGNFTQNPWNDTHTGEMKLWFFQKIPSFIIKSTYRTDAGKIIQSGTMRPCDVKIAKRMMELMEKLSGPPPKSLDGKPMKPLACPIEV